MLPYICNSLKIGERIYINNNNYYKLDNYRLLEWKALTPKELIATGEIPEILIIRRNQNGNG